MFCCTLFDSLECCNYLSFFFHIFVVKVIKIKRKAAQAVESLGGIREMFPPLFLATLPIK